MIEPARLFVSLTIGFVYGALAAILMNLDLANVTEGQVPELAAAGYAGSDFVRGSSTGRAVDPSKTLAPWRLAHR